jgi:hypothetical protein
LDITGARNKFIPRFTMQYHLEVILESVSPGKHAVLVVDKAAWHLTGKLEVPENISIVPLPPYSPELNPVEQRIIVIPNLLCKFMGALPPKPPKVFIQR